MQKKTKNQIKRTYKKNYKKRPKTTIILTILFLLIVAGLFYFAYTNGYLDEFFPNEKKPIEYGSSQNEQGFYYYTNTGFSSGEYYESIKRIEESEILIERLNNIVNKEFNPVSYGDARYILSYSDRDPNDSNRVIGMYDSDSIANYWIGTGTGAWQREHVWPNSRLGIGRVDNNSKNQGSDLHNLRAITGINQTRSNRYFADGSGNAVKVGSSAFYPGDDHKGDVARILFYMFIKYDFLKLTDDENALTNQKTNYTVEGAYAGKLNLLLKWHKEDPVDEFERSRNNFIYSGIAFDDNNKKITPQGNRNPFIDKPELVHLIFEDKTIAELTITSVKYFDNGEFVATRIVLYINRKKDEIFL